MFDALQTNIEDFLINEHACLVFLTCLTCFHHTSFFMYQMTKYSLPICLLWSVDLLGSSKSNLLSRLLSKTPSILHISKDVPNSGPPNSIIFLQTNASLPVEIYQ